MRSFVSGKGYSKRRSMANLSAISEPVGITPALIPAPRNGVHCPILMRETRLSQSASLNILIGASLAIVLPHRDLQDGIGDLRIGDVAVTADELIGKQIVNLRRRKRVAAVSCKKSALHDFVRCHLDRTVSADAAEHVI